MLFQLQLSDFCILGLVEKLLISRFEKCKDLIGGLPRKGPNCALMLTSFVPSRRRSLQADAVRALSNAFRLMDIFFSVSDAGWMVANRARNFTRNVWLTPAHAQLDCWPHT